MWWCDAEVVQARGGKVDANMPSFGLRLRVIPRLPSLDHCKPYSDQSNLPTPRIAQNQLNDYMHHQQAKIACGGLVSWSDMVILDDSGG